METLTIGHEGFWLNLIKKGQIEADPDQRPLRKH